MSLSTHAPGLALNEDDSHFFFTRAGRPLAAADVDAWVDQYAGTQVRELLLCPNCMRASYASGVWDPIWRGYDPAAPDDQPLLASLSPEARVQARNWIHTAWQLDQAGIDVYARWIARCRQRGLSPWLTVRMNDVHNVDDERCYIHSEFWREHPEYRRVPYRFAEWVDRAFDYGRPEVRDYHFKLIEELAGRYDFDGLELDWMRFGFHFAPGREAEGAAVLTEFTARVRRLLDEQQRRRGHPIRLGARVPSRPATAAGLGMDAVAWARAGLIDWLVVTPFWASAETDMPIELWKQLLDGTGVTLCAGLELLLRPYPAYPAYHTNSLATVRGAAASLIDRGADRIYLFNYMDSQTAIDSLDEYPALLNQAGALETIAGRPRRHVLTFADTWAPGEPRAAALPATVPAGGWRAFRLHLGPVAPAGRAAVLLGIQEGAGDAGGMDVRVNGALCHPAGAVTLPQPAPAGPVLAQEVPAGALRRGYNVVEVHPAADLTVGWVELSLEGI